MKIMENRLQHFNKVHEINIKKALDKNVKIDDVYGIKSDKLLDILNPQHDDIILDAGCGVGNFTINLLPKSAYVYGIDSSAEGIDMTKKRIPSNCNNFRLDIGDITNLPYKNSAVNKILCVSVLQYLSKNDIKKAFSEFLRVIKNNGTIVIHFKNGRSLYGFLSFMHRKLNYKNWYSLKETYISPDFIKKCFKECDILLLDFSDPRPFKENKFTNKFKKMLGFSCTMLIKIKK